jgi:NAD(P)-dependent dehydrogenase (short-subunit alcohol dehydrogenase family)
MVVNGSVTGKVAIVTGAAGGIGDAVVKELTRQGAVVHSWDIEFRERSGGPQHIVDVTDGDSIRQALSQVIKESGPPKILVNSAAILVSGGLYDISAEQFMSAMKVNVMGTFLVTQVVTDAMTDGAVVNFASVAGRVAAPDAAAYASTKGAIESFTYSVAGTLATRGIRINAVLPGWIDAGFTEKVLRGIDNPQTVYDAAASAHLAGRMGTPHEVAKAVCFLASDDASFITGTVVPVDGGFLIAH